MTSEEHDKSKDESKLAGDPKQDAPKSSKKPKDEAGDKRSLFLPSAPKEANITSHIPDPKDPNKILQKVELENQYVKGLDKLSKEEFDKLRTLLLANGFVDETYHVPDMDLVKQAEGRRDILIRGQRYTMLHPDHTSKNEVNGSTALSVDGKSVSLEIKDGKVVTESYAEAMELQRSGFSLSKQEPVKQKEAKDKE